MWATPDWRVGTTRAHIGYARSGQLEGENRYFIPH